MPRMKRCCSGHAIKNVEHASCHQAGISAVHRHIGIAMRRISRYNSAAVSRLSIDSPCRSRRTPINDVRLGAPHQAPHSAEKFGWIFQIIDGENAVAPTYAGRQ
jgi:hypothetical protein